MLGKYPASFYHNDVPVSLPLSLQPNSSYSFPLKEITSSYSPSFLLFVVSFFPGWEVVGMEMYIMLFYLSFPSLSISIFTSVCIYVQKSDFNRESILSFNVSVQTFREDSIPE